MTFRVKACSVNPVDTKVRAGTYDDYPDYYSHVPKPNQIIGFDGAGIVESVGSDVTRFSQGDEVFYSGSPIRHGSNAELQLVDSRSAAKKPSKLDFVEAASMPLTYITAYEALVERLEIKKGEQAALLIVNGAGGVGAVASQIASNVLELPAVITTASRPETVDFSKSMGATHTVNHREDIVLQVNDLKLEVPLKYIFITSRTEQYLAPCGEIAAPFGKICSIVQTQEMGRMYGSPWLAKSLSFHWALLGTKPYYGLDANSHGKILDELNGLVDQGKVNCHLTKRLPLTLDGVKEGHRLLEEGRSIGKNALGVDVEGLREAEAFR